MCFCMHVVRFCLCKLVRMYACMHACMHVCIYLMSPEDVCLPSWIWAAQNRLHSLDPPPPASPVCAHACAHILCVMYPSSIFRWFYVKRCVFVPTPKKSVCATRGCAAAARGSATLLEPQDAVKFALLNPVYFMGGRARTRASKQQSATPQE